MDRGSLLMETKTRWTIKSFQPVFSVLLLFDEENKSFSFTDIYKKLNIKKNTAYLYINTLLELRLLEKRDGRYYLGSRVLELARYYVLHHNLIEIVRKIMEKIHTITKETVILSVLSENKALCIHRIDSTNPIKVSSETGRRLPLYAAASPKVLLAFMPQDRAKTIIQETELVPFTKNTLTDKKLLLNELEKIRGNGFAISKGELTDNVIEISVPIFNLKGQIVASLGVAGPDFRMKENIEEIKNILLEETSKITLKN